MESMQLDDLQRPPDNIIITLLKLYTYYYSIYHEAFKKM